MLIEFRVKNFRSIKEQQLLTMVATKDDQLLDNMATVGKLRLLHSAAIYGANASGKSNVIKALKVVEQLVRKSARNTPEDRIDVTPFLLDEETARQPSEFELYFFYNGIRYQYGFTVDAERIYQEWLFAYPKGSPQSWFIRTEREGEKNKSDWEFGRNLQGQKQTIADLTSHNTLFLSRAAQLNHPQLQEVYEWFVRHLHIIDDEYSLHGLESMVTNQIIKDNTKKKRLGNLIASADTGIIDIEAQQEEVDWNELPEPIRKIITSLANEDSDSFSNKTGVKTKLEFNHHNLQGRIIPFKAEDESLGTRRLFGLGGILLEGIDDGDLIIVDELDASLHPLLVRQLIQFFHNPEVNRNHAQLIFNTHDALLLDLTLFRRDQLWFVEKGESGESHLYPLSDFSPRNTEAVSKGYLQGRYGAIPSLDSDDWKKVFDGKKE